MSDHAQHAADGLPLVVPLSAGLDPEQAFLRLASRPHVLFLDSARLAMPTWSRYSFLTADPFDFLTVAADGTDGLSTDWPNALALHGRPTPWPICRRFKAERPGSGPMT